MTIINVDEGTYAIKIQAMKKNEDEPSAMASFLSESAIIENQAGSLSLIITLLDAKTITGFQVKNQAGEEINAFDKRLNEEANTRDEVFKIDELTTSLGARVQYEAVYQGQKIQGDEELRLIFVEESLEKVN
ncbi:NEAT domain-containing protein [Virgibacillus halodenitrificans]|uniref:NEAT domain-containing protein n=1 Tax=Virgibacillus halodenitrificans TaxID=1482 RepID=UPI002DB62791|nr:NEAT domain-containing protein [Virgibacillus halodenitrificans]MEC2158882.1 NEAT domain-containing protein [Virgibacillus halodenitrificans]